mmetsp:Transcript_17708/g.24304  ORF Transcript_17708/g.24304 Transcript_17708/m.24304 type:complete len:155 (+) Transcript_17708:40-504(+)
METNDTIPTLCQSIWWMKPRMIAGLRKPNNDEMSELQKLGIGAIVSLMDDDVNLDLYAKSQIPFLWLPIKGGTVPTMEQITSLKKFIDDMITTGKAVGVHCSNGRRRTGTALASYLIASGSTNKEAMEHLLAVKPDVDLREAQVSFLNDLVFDK